LGINSKIRRFMCKSLDLHKWHYETPNYRICVRCGQCEIRQRALSPEDEYWWITTFERWYKDSQEEKKRIEEVRMKEASGRKKAIEFLKSKGLWKGW